MEYNKSIKPKFLEEKFYKNKEAILDKLAPDGDYKYTYAIDDQELRSNAMADLHNLQFNTSKLDHIPDPYKMHLTSFSAGYYDKDSYINYLRKFLSWLGIGGTSLGLSLSNDKKDYN